MGCSSGCELIDPEELKQLRLDRDFLECLKACGVDNWEGWDYAWEMFHETHPEEEDQ